MKKNAMLIFICLGLMQAAYAVPKEVFIIRHADKLLQPDPGPCLSPKGYIRSVIFAFYFLNKFGEPDIIMAANPKADGPSSSIRELQTVAPLANAIAARRTTGFAIEHPFNATQFEALANDLKKNTKFNDKRVLVCWDHNEIPQLANALGVTPQPPAWASDEFDNVYIIKFNTDGSVKDFNILTQQYNISFDGSWRELYEGLIPDQVQ